MLTVDCSGSPREIGLQHGRASATQVNGSIKFYEGFFQRQIKKSWTEVQEIARGYLPYLQSSWPDYVEEIKALAEGAEVEFESVLALNVRTEIGFGLLNDGCTALSWKTDTESFLGQNWDWNLEQSKNIIILNIQQPGKPQISMMTEAGIIGKIGLNSAGVGVTLNAIKAPGADVKKLPTHLALRTVLNSTSQASARETLLRTGVATACHITIADLQSGAIGLECTNTDIVELEMEEGICTHTNHLLRPHATKDLILLEDSLFRIKRVQELLKSVSGGPSMQGLKGVLKDEKNYPNAICRALDKDGGIETLFSIVMDLKEKYAIVKMGQPTKDGEEFQLRFRKK